VNTSVIRYRVAEFLKRYAPFDALAESDLLDLSGSGRVKFHESEEYVFRQGQPKGDFVWVVQQGRVELIEESSEREQLRDVLGEGDVLGLERFVGNGTCLCSARTATDVILYAIHAALFEALIPRYPAVERYLGRSDSGTSHRPRHRSPELPLRAALRLTAPEPVAGYHGSDSSPQR